MNNERIFWGRKIGEIRHLRSRVQPKEGKMIFTKRRRFVVVSVLLTVYLYVIQIMPVERRLAMIIGFGFLSYLATAWSIFKDLRKIAWLTNMIMPVMYPIAVALFYFLLPQAEVTRVLVLLFFVVSMYGLLLTVNIFSVASIRTIQLLRAARTVGFLLSVLTSAFLYHVIYSFNLSVISVTFFAGLVAFFIFLAGIWSFSLSDRLGVKELRPTLAGTIILAETAMVLTFYMIDPPLASIVLSMSIYVLLGIFQSQIEERLFARTVQEYLGFALIVLTVLVIVAMMRWTS